MKDSVFKTIQIVCMIGIAILLYRIGTNLEQIIVELHLIAIK